MNVEDSGMWDFCYSLTIIRKDTCFLHRIKKKDIPKQEYI